MQNNNKVDASPSILEIRLSGISGQGSFAARHIKRNDFILALSGRPLFTQDVGPHCGSLGISGDDPLQVGDEEFLILDLPSKTINHSCLPNAGIRNKSDLYALRDIYPGEEVTYDYSTTSGIHDNWKMTCGCQSHSCRYVISNVLSIPAEILSNYIRLNALPDFIKLQLQKHTQKKAIYGFDASYDSL